MGHKSLTESSARNTRSCSNQSRKLTNQRRWTYLSPHHRPGIMDVDDDYAMHEQESDPVQPENDEEEEMEQTRPDRKTAKSRGSIYDALDDDDDDEEEDEEEAEDHRGRKRAKVGFFAT